MYHFLNSNFKKRNNRYYSFSINQNSKRQLYRKNIKEMKDEIKNDFCTT